MHPRAFLSGEKSTQWLLYHCYISLPSNYAQQIFCFVHSKIKRDSISLNCTSNWSAVLTYSGILIDMSLKLHEVSRLSIAYAFVFNSYATYFMWRFFGNQNILQLSVSLLKIVLSLMIMLIRIWNSKFSVFNFIHLLIDSECSIETSMLQTRYTIVWSFIISIKVFFIQNSKSLILSLQSNLMYTWCPEFLQW